MFTRTTDGSIIGNDGRVILFSPERFLRDICEGDSCFICGANPEDKNFNNEHVLPDWLLRMFELKGRRITLPNETAFSYERYTIPCCEECNSLLGKNIEEKVKSLISEGQQAIHQHLKTEGPFLLFIWMGLIFLKTHLKDKNLRWHRDLRAQGHKIADLYNWEEFYNLHTIVRAGYVGSDVAGTVLGSFCMLPTKSVFAAGEFDFGDLTAGQTLMLRMGEFAFITVFNDSCGAMNAVRERLARIEGPLSEPQLREVMVELAFMNLALKNRPVFSSHLDFGNEQHRIEAEVPRFVELNDIDLDLRGALLYGATKHLLDAMTAPREIKERLIESVRSGNASFLFNDYGNFIHGGLVEYPDNLSKDC